MYFKALPDLFSVNIVFLVTLKMMSPKKEQNSLIFCIEIVIKRAILAKCFIWKGIIQYLRYLRKQQCHVKVFFGLVLMGAC